MFSSPRFALLYKSPKDSRVLSAFSSGKTTLWLHDISNRIGNRRRHATFTAQDTGTCFETPFDSAPIPRGRPGECYEISVGGTFDQDQRRFLNSVLPTRMYDLQAEGYVLSIKCMVANTTVAATTTVSTTSALVPTQTTTTTTTAGATTRAATTTVSTTSALVPTQTTTTTTTTTATISSSRSSLRSTATTATTTSGTLGKALDW